MAHGSAPASGAWLVTTLASLLLGLVGAVGLAALLGGTPGRRFSAGALVFLLAGTVVFVPVLGLIGVAGPALARIPTSTGAAGYIFDSTAARLLGEGGLTLLGVGWVVMGVAVLGARILNRVDGLLLVLAVCVAVASEYLSWQFLFVVAAMIMVAGGLGLAWSAWRLTPDGRLPDDFP